MGLFRKTESTQAHLKMGLFGFAGSGKSTTASLVAIGLHEHLAAHGHPAGDTPVVFLDTETGSDFVKPRFDAAGIELHTAKTRSFADLRPAVEEAEALRSILIIDSITHFWREFCESYAKKRNRRRGLEFSDWNYLKTEWGKFTDLYVNSNAHIIMCGRAGHEYDFFEDETGKKQLEKTGIKMKGESEMGYEPNVLVLMERSMDLDDNSVARKAYVLKERFGVIDGKVFDNPSFQDFLPHVELLNLGGAQLGVDSSRNSEDMIPAGDSSWKYEEKQREILLDELAELLKKHFPSQSADDKAERADRLEAYFGTRSWKKVETYGLNDLRIAYEAMHQALEKCAPAEVSRPPAARVDAPF